MIKYLIFCFVLCAFVLFGCSVSSSRSKGTVTQIERHQAVMRVADMQNGLTLRRFRVRPSACEATELSAVDVIQSRRYIENVQLSDDGNSLAYINSNSDEMVIHTNPWHAFADDVVVINDVLTFSMSSRHGGALIFKSRDEHALFVLGQDRNRVFVYPGIPRGMTCLEIDVELQIGVFGKWDAKADEYSVWIYDLVNNQWIKGVSNGERRGSVAILIRGDRIAGNSEGGRSATLEVLWPGSVEAKNLPLRDGLRVDRSIDGTLSVSKDGNGNDMQPEVPQANWNREWNISWDGGWIRAVPTKSVGGLRAGNQVSTLVSWLSERGGVQLFPEASLIRAAWISYPAKGQRWFRFDGERFTAVQFGPFRNGAVVDGTRFWVEE